MYISVDGDNIGQILTNCIYSNSVNDTKEFSYLVTKFFKQIEEKVKILDGDIIFCAGDSIAFTINDNLVNDILPYINTKDFNVTIGIGKTLKQAHWALNVAKSLGKNRILDFNDIKNEFID